MLEEQVIRPLNLRNTGVSPGEDKRAVIPNVEQQGWGADYGYNAPYVANLSFSLTRC